MSIVKIIFNLFFYEDIHPCHLLLNICELETASDNKRKEVLCKATTVWQSYPAIG